jgi:hypothetical protein
VTWKHVLIVTIGAATACFGAWMTCTASGAIGGPMVITLGASIVTGALGHAGQGVTLARGAIPSSYLPSTGSMPHEKS